MGANVVVRGHKCPAADAPPGKARREVRKKAAGLLVLLVLSLAAGCGWEGATTKLLPTPMPPPTDRLEPSATRDPAADGATPACPPATGEGTVSPAASIYSIVFVVNGVEQVVRDGDMLEALPGDEVQVREVTICAGSFQGRGGEACVDFAPVDQSGEEIASAHGGSHTVTVIPGFTSISGPDHRWTVGDNWISISAVLNHWPTGGTADLGCGGGRCERDDRIVVELR
jgi:hypothetical protein